MKAEDHILDTSSTHESKVDISIHCHLKEEPAPEDIGRILIVELKATNTFHVHEFEKGMEESKLRENHPHGLRPIQVERRFEGNAKAVSSQGVKYAWHTITQIL